jgi:NAD(P)-dependent dehydrogenase (short-subunit alcohol dehydrogenase family)
MLASLPDNYRVAVFGATGGIGAALVEQLSDDARCAAIYVGARRAPAASGKLRPFQFNLEDETSIASAARQFEAGGPLHLVLVATGVLHSDDMQPEKSWRALSPETLARAFAINATGPALIAKHTLGLLSREDKAVFAALSARVGSIGDNRLGGWHAYRASKAALNMMVKCCSIELSRRNPSAVCVTLHPGTVDTALSQPFQRIVTPEKLFSAEHSARELMAVLERLEPNDSGACFAWDGQRMPA